MLTVSACVALGLTRLRRVIFFGCVCKTGAKHRFCIHTQKGCECRRHEHSENCNDLDGHENQTHSEAGKEEQMKQPRAAGLSNIRVEGRLMPLDYAFFQMAFRSMLQRAQDAGTISEEELARFWKALEQAEQEQRFFARVGGFVVSGRKAA